MSKKSMYCFRTRTGVFVIHALMLNQKFQIGDYGSFDSDDDGSDAARAKQKPNIPQLKVTSAFL